LRRNKVFQFAVSLLDWTFIPAVKTQDNNFFGAGGVSSTPPIPLAPLLFTCDSDGAHFSNFILQITSAIAIRRIWVKDLNTAKIIFDQTYTPAKT
jgi:hypothetical protein